MDTVVLPTPPTSGAIVSGYSNNDNCIKDLILSNNISDGTRAIMAEVANGNASIIAADQAGHLVNQKTTGDASVANLKATYDAQVAGINATNLGAVSTTKTVTDSGLANLTSTERNSGEIRMNVAKEAGEGRLASAISSGEIRELISKTSFDNMIAIKDNGFAIREEGCKTRETVLVEGHRTREKEAEHFAALQLQAEKHRNDIEKEMLKGFAATQLDACKNEARLAAKIDEICCCVEKDNEKTRHLIAAETAARQAAQIQRQEMEILILKSRHDGHK